MKKLLPCAFVATAAVVSLLSLTALAGTDDTPKDINKNVIEKPVAPPRFYVEIGAVGEFDYHATKFISDGNAVFNANGLVNPHIPQVGVSAIRPAIPVILPSATLAGTIQSRDFTSTHDAGAVDGRLNFGYIINPLLTVYGGFIYTHDDGDHSRRLGSVTDTSGFFLGGAAGASYDLYGDVSQYQSFAGIAGVKITLPRTILDLIHAPKFITPYFNVSAGGKYIQGEHLRLYTSTIDTVNTTVRLYDPSLVFTTQGGFGYEFKLARNFSINVDTDYGYDTKPDSASTRLDLFGVNRGGDRLYETVGLSAVFKF